MNDSETKVMTFTSVYSASITPTAEGATSIYNPFMLLNGAIAGDSITITPQSGRLFFAGMMFDRLRVLSLSITIRPQSMPSSSATNYTLYAAWDRYGGTSDSAAETSYSIQSDPSAKQVVWSSGGSGTPLRSYIYATRKDRYQYFPIKHNTSLVSWSVSAPTSSQQLSSPSSPFFPTLMVAVSAVATDSTVAQFSILCRATVEFQGGYSNNTLNYTPANPAAASASEAPAVLLEERVAALERMYNSNPADNNDDFVSVLNELSNPQ